MHKASFFFLLAVSCSVMGADGKAFWSYGSAEYTDKTTWVSECRNKSIDGKRYRIGKDIVACVTKTPDGKPYNLVMAHAAKFSKEELAKMHDSAERPELPSRDHPQFKCLRLTSGWMC